MSDPSEFETKMPSFAAAVAALPKTSKKGDADKATKVPLVWQEFPNGQLPMLQ